MVGPKLGIKCTYNECCRRRCRKYHIQGKKKGSVEKFINHLPGMPDNIRYDGDGLYWIALATVLKFITYICFIYYYYYCFLFLFFNNKKNKDSN